MYELIILSHLMRQPAHGYMIASIINDMIGPYARISNGRLYPLLLKLEKSGLIVPYTQASASQQSDRQLRTYEITEAGRLRFHELMMNTTSNPGEYQKIFLQKVSMLEFLKPSERMRLLDHYINYCQAHVLHITAEADDFAQQSPNWGTEWGPNRIKATLDVMQHMVDQWQLELDWAKALREQELARIESSDSTILEERKNPYTRTEDTYSPEGD
ncbi:MAG TPA: PadR family transcriptional regulator [Ktedonobacteraceae bacterium]|nr:PadR family transcriptional regulator [Ktedonobacteraceae bacterium]